MPASPTRPGSSAFLIVNQLRKSSAELSHVGPRRTSIRKRIDVISPDLCDDALRRLQPSLPSTAPLDIIDVHPGVCLWSSKVHDALQPRHHVLVEPDRNIYASYIDPLLLQQGSRYRHVSVLSDLFEPPGAECLPHQRAAVTSLTSPPRTNDSLLILANLTKLESSQSTSKDLVTGNLHQYINGMLNQKSSFHHYGLVRMLAWVPDAGKHPILPRIISDRRRFTVRLDLVAQVNEIAGSDEDTRPRHAKRQHDLTIESEQLIRQRAKDTGVWTPQHRRQPPPTIPWYEIPLADNAWEQLRKLPKNLHWQEEMLALDDALRQAQHDVEKVPSELEDGAEKTRIPAPKKLVLLRSHFAAVRKAYADAQGWAKRQTELDKAEIRSLTEGLTPSEIAATRASISREAAELHDEMQKRGRKDLLLIARRYIDDRRAFEHDPPILQWDRRTAEPLLVNDDEFSPAKKLALLDFQPVPDALPQLLDFDKRTCFEYMCYMLFSHTAQPVNDGLKAVLQGGLADFVQKVPNLTDPLKGGKANLDDLSVRMLPGNLVVELALALETWPFRKASHEMIMTTGEKKTSVIFDDD